MHEKVVNPWRKIKIHSDGSIEVDPSEIMRQYREQFRKTGHSAPDRAKDFGKLQKRPSQ